MLDQFMFGRGQNRCDALLQLENDPGWLTREAILPLSCMSACSILTSTVEIHQTMKRLNSGCTKNYTETSYHIRVSLSTPAWEHWVISTLLHRGTITISSPKTSPSNPAFPSVQVLSKSPHSPPPLFIHPTTHQYLYPIFKKKLQARNSSRYCF